MGTRKEYFVNDVLLTADEVDDLRYYNDTIIAELKDPGKQDLASIMGEVSAILTFISVGISTTALSIAGAITTLVSLCDISEKSLS